MCVNIPGVGVKATAPLTNFPLLFTGFLLRFIRLLDGRPFNETSINCAQIAWLPQVKKSARTKIGEIIYRNSVKDRKNNQNVSVIKNMLLIMIRALF